MTLVTAIQKKNKNKIDILYEKEKVSGGDVCYIVVSTSMFS